MTADAELPSPKKTKDRYRDGGMRKSPGVRSKKAAEAGAVHLADVPTDGPTHADFAWVYQNFTNMDVAAETAPSAGAWGLLQMARNDESVFKTVLDRLTPKTFFQEEVEEDEEEEKERPEPIGEILKRDPAWLLVSVDRRIGEEYYRRMREIHEHVKVANSKPPIGAMRVEGSPVGRGGGKRHRSLVSVADVQGGLAVVGEFFRMDSGSESERRGREMSADVNVVLPEQYDGEAGEGEE